jgi:outer membrane protein TolC
MKKSFLIFCLFASSGAFAEASRLSLANFLAEVKRQNPEAVATLQKIEAAENKLNEALVDVRPEFYASYNILDDKQETQAPLFMGDRTRTWDWRTGVRTDSSVGLGANLYFDSTRTNIADVSPSIFPVNDYNQSKVVLELKQSLWRNGFGGATSAKIDATSAADRAELLKNKYALKTLLLNAENTFWGVVSMSETQKLQEENVARATRIRDLMARQAQNRLTDDVEAMQAEASLQTRQLELETTRNQLAVLVRTLNTQRGVDSDQVGEVEELPPKDLLAIVNIQHSKKISREDFEMIREQANAEVAKAKGADSMIQPQLDINASYATNGRDGQTSAAWADLDRANHPTFSAGVNFSIPLDYGLIRDLKRSYRAAKEAGKSAIEQANFQEERFWNDLLKQKMEAQGRFERGVNLENIQTSLVKKQRQRLINGRTTTFETLTFEQNLAFVQIQRVNAQLDLLKVHNTIKTFEVKQ